MARRQRLDLTIDWIDLVAPAAVQEDERRSRPHVAIMNRHRRGARRKRRRGDRHNRHEPPMLRYGAPTMKQTIFVAAAFAGVVLTAQTAPLTPEQTLDRRAIGERGRGPAFAPARAPPLVHGTGTGKAAAPAP